MVFRGLQAVDELTHAALRTGEGNFKRQCAIGLTGHRGVGLVFLLAEWLAVEIHQLDRLRGGEQGMHFADGTELVGENARGSALRGGADVVLKSEVEPLGQALLCGEFGGGVGFHGSIGRLHQGIGEGLRIGVIERLGPLRLKLRRQLLGIGFEIGHGFFLRLQILRTGEQRQILHAIDFGGERIELFFGGIVAGRALACDDIETADAEHGGSDENAGEFFFLRCHGNVSGIRISKRMRISVSAWVAPVG